MLEYTHVSDRCRSYSRIHRSGQRVWFSVSLNFGWIPSTVGVRNSRSETLGDESLVLLCQEAYKTKRATHQKSKAATICFYDLLNSNLISNTVILGCNDGFNTDVEAFLNDNHGIELNFPSWR